MARLFVPLDVNYAEDDKIIGVGPMAELLYLRSLVFVKRARSNGNIRCNQLSSIALRIPRAQHHADTLVEAGLWERNGSGWYIAAWLKRNPVAVEPVSDELATAGSLGAHVRWHVNEGRPSSDCKYCVAEGLSP